MRVGAWLRPAWFRVGCVSRASGPRRHFSIKDLLIYSTEVEGVIDTSRKRSTPREIHQTLVTMQKDNEYNARVIYGREEDNLSVALPFIFGGAALVQRGESAQPVETIEMESHIHDDEFRPIEPDLEPPVYPYDIVHRTHFPTRPKIAGEVGPEPALGRRRGRGRRVVHEANEAQADLTVVEGERAKSLSEDDHFRYGTADPEIPPSQVPCGGCGAHLHCQDSKSPGFLPETLFTGQSAAQLRNMICQRCYVLKTYNIALKMNVAPEDYANAIAHVGPVNQAMVLLIIDLTDCPGSVWPNIFDLIGTNKRVILVGNKADLLPQDSDSYLKRVQASMEQAFFTKCSRGEVKYSPRVVSSILVSARTGFNIERLISMIHGAWDENRRRVGGDIFLIGTTNVGKSSLFNILLESDLCKINAIDNVEKAMVSPVPGTTLNLLKFPVMRPDPSRVHIRKMRLKQAKGVFRYKEIERIANLRKHRSREYAGCRGIPVVNSFLSFQQDKYMPLTGGAFDLERVDPTRNAPPARLDPLNPDFAEGKWCYDTPGSVSHDQVINLLTQEEITKVLPNFPIQPRSFLLKTGQTMFLAGLARVDLIDGPFKYRPLVLTVFCSDYVPINIVRTVDAERFYQKAFGTEVLGVPMGNSLRLQDFPALESQVFIVDSVSHQEATSDIVLSSVGWIMPVPGAGKLATIRAWTPEGKGLVLRDPPFLPFAQTLRGKRIGGTPTYDNDKFYIPHTYY